MFFTSVLNTCKKWLCFLFIALVSIHVLKLYKYLPRNWSSVVQFEKHVITISGFPTDFVIPNPSTANHSLFSHPLYRKANVVNTPSEGAVNTVSNQAKKFFRTIFQTYCVIFLYSGEFRLPRNLSTTKYSLLVCTIYFGNFIKHFTWGEETLCRHTGVFSAPLPNTKLNTPSTKQDIDIILCYLHWKAYIMGFDKTMVAYALGTRRDIHL